jgi:hypothetical protein
MEKVEHDIWLMSSSDPDQQILRRGANHGCKMTDNLKQFGGGMNIRWSMLVVGLNFTGHE